MWRMPFFDATDKMEATVMSSPTAIDIAACLPETGSSLTRGTP